MKINRLEAHDRLLYFKQDQALNISKGAEDCLKKNPLTLRLRQYSPYVYLFAHPRTADDGVNKRMIWQPRLTKPSAQTNSYLFRSSNNDDILETCWLLPPRETWSQYNKGNLTEHELVRWSIHQFINNRFYLERSFSDDLDDDMVRNIYTRVAFEMDEERRMNTLYAKPNSSEEFLTSLAIGQSFQQNLHASDQV